MTGVLIVCYRKPLFRDAPRNEIMRSSEGEGCAAGKRCQEGQSIQCPVNRVSILPRYFLRLLSLCRLCYDLPNLSIFFFYTLFWAPPFFATQKFQAPLHAICLCYFPANKTQDTTRHDTTHGNRARFFLFHLTLAVPFRVGRDVKFQSLCIAAYHDPIATI